MSGRPGEVRIKGGIDSIQSAGLGQLFASLFDGDGDRQPIPFTISVLLFSMTEIRKIFAELTLAEDQIFVHEFQSIESISPIQTDKDLCLLFDQLPLPQDEHKASATVQVCTSDRQNVVNLRMELRKMSGNQLQALKGSILPKSAKNEELFWLQTKPISAETLSAYIELSGDENPIHTDHEYAISLGFERTVVPGMLIAGLTQTALSRSHPQSELKQLRIRFLAPVTTGQIIKIGVQEKAASGNLRALRVYYLREDETIAAIADVKLQNI